MTALLTPAEPTRSRSAAVLVWRLGWRVLRELGWLIAAPVRLLVGWPRTCAVALIVGVVASMAGHGRALVVPGVLVGLLVVWHRAGPVSFERVVARRFRRVRRAHRLRRGWPVIMRRTGLAVREANLAARWDKNAPAEVTHLPRLRRLRWESGQLVADVGLLLGQTTQDVQHVTEAIRQGLGAALVRVLPVGATGTQLRLTFGDVLREPFPPIIAGSFDLRALPMGRTDDGGTWSMRLGPHTLVAGSSGSGKASLVWGLAFAVAPAIRAGLVEVHGVDLKGGMELSMGERLLTRYARTAPEAVQLLEEAAVAMQGRARRLAGTTRQHEPSVAEPHVVVLVDELAALTAYLGDRDLTRRAHAALGVLCSQGRAVGYTVFACLQDPRKETIPVRGLFTQMIGLRLKDREETAMVLGDGARDAGAECHKIPASTPGVGYLIPETGGPPVRVRGALITDDHIRDVAARFPAPHRVPVVVPEPVDPPARPSRTRTKAQGEKVTDRGEAA